MGDLDRPQFVGVAVIATATAIATAIAVSIGLDGFAVDGGIAAVAIVRIAGERIGRVIPAAVAAAA